MADFIVLAVIGLIIGLAAGYIRKEKKKGKTCVGCPYSDQCSEKRNGGCGGCQR